jgi:hypothetical protein
MGTFGVGSKLAFPVHLVLWGILADSLLRKVFY